MKAIGTDRLAALAVAALVVMAYANHFQNGFHFDDSHAILDNPFVRDLGHRAAVFLGRDHLSMLPQDQSYRPVLQATLAFDYWLAGGYVPWVFQLDTFVWFLLQLLVMWRLFRRALQLSAPEQDIDGVALAAVAVYCGASRRGGDRQLRDPARRDPVDAGCGRRAVVLRGGSRWRVAGGCGRCPSCWRC